MRTVSITATPASQKRTSESNLIATDTLVYLVLVLLIWSTWQISKMNLFSAGDDAGYWIGVAGGSMMLLLFLYPLRKHFQFARGWGKVKWWFVVHMFLGVAGPLLILLHSNFRIGSLNAGVALFSMLIVAFSGVVGRFIYARVHRGLSGEQTDFKTLQSRAGLDQEEVRSRLAFAPAVEAALKSFQEKESIANAGWLTHLRRVFWLPVQQWITYHQCVAALQTPLRRLGEHNKWNDSDKRRRDLQSRKMVRRYLNAVTLVARYTAYERLFALWHVAHIPFVYLLGISAIVHVIAVHAY